MKAIRDAALIILILLAAGCGMRGESPGNQPSEQQAGEEKVQVDADLGEKAKKAAEAVKGVQGSTAVLIDNEISAAVKVGGFDRLRLKPIKKEVQEKIKALNKNMNVYVTTDKKLFMQLQQIEEQLNASGQEEMTDIKMRVKKINQDMQG